MSDTTSGCALGLASLAVGATELAFPKQLEKTMGVGDGEMTGVLWVLGVREILHGLDLLLHDDPAPALIGRVAGDLLDGAVLAMAGARARNPLGFGLIAAAVAPIVIADMLCAMNTMTEAQRGSRATHWRATGPRA